MSDGHSDLRKSTKRLMEQLVDPKPMTFEEAWAEMAKQGYQYGTDALEQVKFGWEIHLAVSLAMARSSLGVAARPPWPEVWMTVAHTVARRSVDPAVKVGAIIVPEDNTAILSLGYNGMWKGGPNVVESLERGKSGTVHAEVNALIKCDFNINKKKHLYVTDSPCRDCAKLVVNGCISRVVYDRPYRDMSGVQLLLSAGVEVLSLPEAIDLAHRG